MKNLEEVAEEFRNLARAGVFKLMANEEKAAGVFDGGCGDRKNRPKWPVFCARDLVMRLPTLMLRPRF